jgi:hypothetical protein
VRPKRRVRLNASAIANPPRQTKTGCAWSSNRDEAPCDGTSTLSDRSWQLLVFLLVSEKSALYLGNESCAGFEDEDLETALTPLRTSVNGVHDARPILDRLVEAIRKKWRH